MTGVPVMAGRVETHPFDATARAYDAQFTGTLLGRHLRGAVWERLEEHLRPGTHVLELNCGTGEDALWMAQRGARITATDGSAEMLAVARAKVEQAGMGGVEFRQLDLSKESDWRTATVGAAAYDGVLSNFGGLNCLATRRPVARALAALVRPGGWVVLVVMGPLCPWELLWYLGHGQLHAAFRRFRPGVEARIGDGAMVQVWYPSPQRLQAEFAPWFRPTAVAGVGVLLPPSYLGHLVERWPALFEHVARIERRLAAHFPATRLNDHYFLALERTEAAMDVE